MLKKIWPARLAAAALLCLAATAAGLFAPPRAQAAQIKLNDLIEETQLLAEDPDEMTFVWWIPDAFWEVSFSQDGAYTETEIGQFLDAVAPYTFFIVADGTIGFTGEVAYRSKEEIRDALSMVDANGAVFRPVAEDTVDSFVMSFLNMMKPVFVNMLGPMGENMNFFIFESNEDGVAPSVDPKKEGSLKLMLGERKYEWRLPLNSILDPKFCPVDGEKMNGSWKFCPYHGVSLDGGGTEAGEAPAGNEESMPEEGH